MAKNTGNASRIGSIKGRTQTFNPNTGRFIDQKSNGEPFKGVAQETDKRRK